MRTKHGERAVVILSCKTCLPEFKGCLWMDQGHVEVPWPLRFPCKAYTGEGRDGVYLLREVRMEGKGLI